MRKRRAPSLTVGLSLVFAPMVAAAFGSVDRNGDGRITRDELHASLAAGGTLARWDKDSDALIDKREFRAFESGGRFEAWDANTDGYLDARELSDGLHVKYDTDKDGAWDKGELNAARSAALLER